ncbi:ion channel [Amaricoccus sp.]|uniref:ion channel n=1 Tax=Amaricoccus sp. TaxID=1872485 RepID=UPI00261C44D3|nr:ion channel [Amaricoccus sp.]HRO10468.1 ion channel [Amaricoccus sp.]
MDGIAEITVAAPGPLVEILVGMIGLVVIIFVHGAALRVITRRFNRSWVGVTAGGPHWRANLLLGVTIAALSLTHFAETLIWAIPISGAGMIPAMRDSYFFVLQSYTTLGAGDVTLPDPWRLIGPIIAMSGLFTFSWTAGVLVSVMTEFGKLDRAGAELGREERSDPD